MLTYNFANKGSDSLYEYLYKCIKNDILLGNLGVHEKLPSKRSFAKNLGISVLTVENAYEQLMEEGYIYWIPKKGFYVADLRELNLTKTLSVSPSSTLLSFKEKVPYLADFTSNQTDSEIFPFTIWARTMRELLNENQQQLMENPPCGGIMALRQAIADYLHAFRGMVVNPEQIIVGAGTEYLYGLLIQLLGDDKIYGIEDPSYHQIRKVYEGTGAVCEMLPMGEDGIRSDVLAQTRADVLHVTPFHSFPSGVTATIGKRYEYLEWAREKHHFIVEDDFDSEFFMPGKPVETLFMLDDSSSVIYINTFSKSLSPSIRMGYMILPERLMERYKKTSGGFSCTVPVLEQYALAEFINKGYFEQHLSRVRRKQNHKMEV